MQSLGDWAVQKLMIYYIERPNGYNNGWHLRDKRRVQTNEVHCTNHAGKRELGIGPSFLRFGEVSDRQWE